MALQQPQAPNPNSPTQDFSSEELSHLLPRNFQGVAEVVARRGCCGRWVRVLSKSPLKSRLATETEVGPLKSPLMWPLAGWQSWFKARLGRTARGAATTELVGGRALASRRGVRGCKRSGTRTDCRFDSTPSLHNVCVFSSQVVGVMCSAAAASPTNCAGEEHRRRQRSTSSRPRNHVLVSGPLATSNASA